MDTPFGTEIEDTETPFGPAVEPEDDDYYQQVFLHPEIEWDGDPDPRPDPRTHPEYWCE